jgi:hypothetical protein
MPKWNESQDRILIILAVFFSASTAIVLFSSLVSTHSTKTLHHERKNALCPTGSVISDFVRNQRLRIPPQDFDFGSNINGEGRAWMQRNWEPNIRCAANERFGPPGEGGKWVCDPYCLLKRRDCLVYSIGSMNDFTFEESLAAFQCEIHTFDHTVEVPRPPPEIHFHSIGISAFENKSGQLESLAMMIHELGHSGRIIDILKIDVEGTEYEIFTDSKTLRIMKRQVRQLLIEVHLSSGCLGMTEPQIIEIAKNIASAGFRTFSKEPNIMFSTGSCAEFSLLNLNLIN